MAIIEIVLKYERIKKTKSQLVLLESKKKEIIAKEQLKLSQAIKYKKHKNLDRW